MRSLAGHDATALRRKSGQSPYVTTEAKTGGFIKAQAVPADQADHLPTHLQACHSTRFVPLFKLVHKQSPAVSIPAGCSVLAPSASNEADLFVVEEFSDMDLKVSADKQFVPDLVVSNATQLNGQKQASKPIGSYVCGRLVTLCLYVEL